MEYVDELHILTAYKLVNVTLRLVDSMKGLIMNTNEMKFSIAWWNAVKQTNILQSLMSIIFS